MLNSYKPHSFNSNHTTIAIRKCQVANRMTQAWQLTEAGMREATKYAKEHRHD